MDNLHIHDDVAKARVESNSPPPTFDIAKCPPTFLELKDCSSSSQTNSDWIERLICKSNMIYFQTPGGIYQSTEQNST